MASVCVMASHIWAKMRHLHEHATLLLQRIQYNNSSSTAAVWLAAITFPHPWIVSVDHMECVVLFVGTVEVNALVVSGRGSLPTGNTQPSHWDADILPLSYCRPSLDIAVCLAKERYCLVGTIRRNRRELHQAAKPKQQLHESRFFKTNTSLTNVTLTCCYQYKKATSVTNWAHVCQT